MIRKRLGKNMENKINDILNQQNFEVNEPPLNRKETVEKLIKLFKQQNKKFLKEIKKWIENNIMEYSSDLLLINSEELLIFLEELYE